VVRKATKITPQVEAGANLPVMMKKPEFLDAIVKRTSLKKRDVKPAVEAALAVIVEALKKGEELHLPPMGKIRIVKAKELDAGAQVLTLKLRTIKSAALASQRVPAATDD
jgi:nucleoid DNA-binding protein